MIYFKFKDKNYLKVKTDNKRSILDRFLNFILSPIIANPDYENKMNLVYEWLIEYDEKENYIEREIGLNKDGIVIMKMPFNKNYGFWLDTNMKFDDFKRQFEVEIINETEFSKKWNELQ